MIKKLLIVFSFLLALESAGMAMGRYSEGSTTPAPAHEILKSKQNEIDTLEEQLKQGFREYTAGVQDWGQFKQLEANFYRANFDAYLYLNVLYQEMVELRKKNARNFQSRKFEVSIEDQIEKYRLLDDVSSKAYRLTARKLAEIESEAGQKQD